MEIKDLTVIEMVDLIKSKQLSAAAVCEYYLKRIEKAKEYNAIIEVFADCVDKAKQIDEKIKSDIPCGKLVGIPVIIKDNIMYGGKTMTCASKFLKGFVSPYTSTVVKKLLDEDAIIIGRANMDEFAMGGSCEKSVYGATLNACDKSRVAGGSSGGSAVSVKLDLAPIAIGTDTGGSIRQPSSFNGVVGMKPTYGTVSRYGLVAFASSTDQAGPITKSIEDNEYVLDIISGKDEYDQTSIDNKISGQQTSDKIVVGLCKELKEKIQSLASYPLFKKQIEDLRAQGIEIKEISVPHISSSLACYYILTPAEAASNLARFDGVKYAVRDADAKTIDDIYVKSRSAGFGEEVKRRIMLGNFVLSSGYFDAYYKKSKQLQLLLKQEFDKAFDSCDVIITPTTPGEAFKLGEKAADPVQMYLEDLFTVPASIAGVPALSIDYAKGENGLPLGLQLIGKPKTERKIYKLAKIIKKERK